MGVFVGRATHRPDRASADAISRNAELMSAVTRELLAKYGNGWTHALAINDIYFDYAVPELIKAGSACSRPAMAVPPLSCAFSDPNLPDPHGRRAAQPARLGSLAAYEAAEGELLVETRTC